MALLIDTRELARTGRTLEGTLDVGDLPRLASLLAREEGLLHWQARGERRERADGGHDDLLHVELSSEVHMQCVRCLADAPVELRVANAFRLVGSDEQAEREDLEDSEFDVLVGGARFDLGELIEDEAIMGLPS
ncbi:MAG TPA: YceD family protein, partial [Burkholderiaceae bacterium]|nr:YceD family protein [Burkholderiaceae bacterium]